MRSSPAEYSSHGLETAVTSGPPAPPPGGGNYYYEMNIVIHKL